MLTGFITQDTIKPKIVIRINTEKLIPDSVFMKLDEIPYHIKMADSISRIKRIPRTSPEIIITDTTSVCARNSIADVTFYDSLSFIRNLKQLPANRSFPFLPGEKQGTVKHDRKLTIIKSLKDGKELPERPFDHDWLIVVIFFLAYLYLIIRSTTKNIFAELIRFLMFRGINESSSRNTGQLFTWQSTILNFIVFTVIGLFAFCAAEWYDFIPAGISSFLFMLISLGIVISGITSRHFICMAAGSLSSQSEVFSEYLVTVYQSYRYSSVMLSVLIILVSYTLFLPPGIYFITGLIVMIIFYLYRISRLLLIFIKRNISILYLILYLCALEILPVLILVKYFTGVDL